MSDPEERIDQVLSVASRWLEYARAAGVSEGRAKEIAASISDCCEPMR